MLHDDLIGDLTLAIGDEDSSFFLVSFVKFLFEEDSCFIILSIPTLADLLFVIQDVQQMTSYGRSEDQA